MICHRSIFITGAATGIGAATAPVYRRITRR